MCYNTVRPQKIWGGNERVKKEKKKNKKYKMNSLQFQIYLLGWVVLGVGIAFYFIWIKSGLSLHVPCALRTLTGYYCPGCGATRALEQLLQGHFFKSLWYHPVVPYGAVVYTVFMVTNTVELLSDGKYPIGMKYRNGYLYGAIVLVIFQVIEKNLLLYLAEL